MNGSNDFDLIVRVRVFRTMARSAMLSIESLFDGMQKSSEVEVEIDKLKRSFSLILYEYAEAAGIRFDMERIQ